MVGSGYITRSIGGVNNFRICESMEKEGDIEVKYIEHAEKLPWDGGYLDAEYAKCGDEALASSFLALYSHVEGHVPKPVRKVVIRAGEAMILHFSEAGRSDELYLDILHRNFRAGHRVGSKPIEKARIWKTSCCDIYAALETTSQETKGKEKDEPSKDIARAEGLLKDIRLLHRPQHKHGYFLLKDMPMHLSKDGPVDTAWAERELARSDKLDFDEASWGFLMKRFSWSTK
ncbi:hypothetical protein ACP70R_047800 [Stipagrostis hirtigluma subsp. patula]